MRHTGAARDALPASAHTESSRRGALFWSRRKLLEGLGMVSKKNAALVSRPNHHREKSELLCNAWGKFKPFHLNYYRFGSLFSLKMVSLWPSPALVHWSLSSKIWSECLIKLLLNYHELIRCVPSNAIPYSICPCRRHISELIKHIMLVNMQSSAFIHFENLIKSGHYMRRAAVSEHTHKACVINNISSTRRDTSRTRIHSRTQSKY